MADNFKCPKCGSGRTKPLSVAIAGGTRRRNTVGISRRSMWGSTSTYKSDLVSSLPQRPSNVGAYFLMFLGVCGLLLAIFVGSNEKGAEGFAIVVGVVSLLLLLGGMGAKTRPDQLAGAQASWDSRWICARCGHKLEKVVPAGTYQLGNMLAKGKRVTVEPSDAEEALLWKMCSKLIHPSSWVINHPADTIRCQIVPSRLFRLRK